MHIVYYQFYADSNVLINTYSIGAVPSASHCSSMFSVPGLYTMDSSLFCFTIFGGSRTEIAQIHIYHMKLIIMNYKPCMELHLLSVKCALKFK